MTVHPERVSEVLSSERATGFTLRYDFSSQPRQLIRFGRANRSKVHAALNLETAATDPQPPSWVPLIEGLAKMVRLAIAGTGDHDYVGWQRCADPLYYLEHYGPIDGFRILHPGPPPTDEIEKLDISQNPGRLEFIRGGPAFVCADLWLGPAFWEYAPCSREDVIRLPWLDVRDTDYFLYIKAYHAPFTRPEGEQGEIQRRLWRLLFHSDCLWPPNALQSATAGHP
jgi:hypothetical protein